MESKIRPGIDVPAAPKPRTENALSFSNVGPGIEGDFGAESSRIPFLSIGQKTSDICENNPAALGSIIYAGKHLVPKPAVISIYGARQYYKQNLVFERSPTVRPRTFTTKEQVLAAGGNLERFVKPGVDEDNYVPEMICKVAIFSKAKGRDAWAARDDIMSHAVGGNGTLAVPMLWTVRGVTYGQTVPNLRMIDRALREEGKEIAYARFHMNVVKQTFSSNSTFVAVLDRLEEDNSKDVVEVLHKIFAD